jgi:hypothetical protein
MTGKSGVEDAFFDIAAHFLSAEHNQLNLRIVDSREVAAFVAADIEAGLFKQIEGCVLKAPLGNSQF